LEFRCVVARHSDPSPNNNTLGCSWRSRSHDPRLLRRWTVLDRAECFRQRLGQRCGFQHSTSTLGVSRTRSLDYGSVYSADGITWQSSGSVSGNPLFLQRRGVAFSSSQSRWVAVGDPIGTFPAPPANSIATSVDGITRAVGNSGQGSCAQTPADEARVSCHFLAQDQPGLQCAVWGSPPADLVFDCSKQQAVGWLEKRRGFLGGKGDVVILVEREMLSSTAMVTFTIIIGYEFDATPLAPRWSRLMLLALHMIIPAIIAVRSVVQGAEIFLLSH
jgi:hypothetical protein